MHVDLHDWTMAVEGAGLTARPSLRSVLRQLWVTLLCALLMGLLALVLGFPPGSRLWHSRAGQAAAIEQRAAIARSQAQRLRSSATFDASGSVAGREYERLTAAAEELDRRARQHREQLGRQRPTLGPVGDAIYWGVMAALALVGVGLPLLAPLAQVTLDYQGPPGRGTLVVRQWFLVGRTRRVEVAELHALIVHVHRLVTTGSRRRRRVADHGWLWLVQLLHIDADKKVHVRLSLVVEHHPTLPPRLADLTARVREVVRYLEAVTALAHEPPLQTDVVSVEADGLGRRWRFSTRQG